MSGRRNTPYEAGQKYSAAAISLVFHSRSPLVPTFRADGELGPRYQLPGPPPTAHHNPHHPPPRPRSVRFFEISGDGGWFGGGADLTPYYLVDSDCAAFHRHYKTICDGYSVPMGYKEEGSLYADLKVSEWASNSPHRKTISWVSSAITHHLHNLPGSVRRILTAASEGGVPWGGWDLLR